MKDINVMERSVIALQKRDQSDLPSVSEVLLRQSVCSGAELILEPHGKGPNSELQGPARGEPWTSLPEREVSHGLVWGGLKQM